MREFWRRVPGGAYWTNLFGERVTTGCKTRRLARLWKDARILERANPSYAAAQKADLDGAIAELLAELRRRGRAAGTIDKVRKKLGHFNRIWGEDCRLITIDARKVSAYIDQRLTEVGTGDATVKRITIRDELAALRQMLKLARRHKHYPHHVEDVLPDRFETGHRPRTDYVPFDRLPALIWKLAPHRVGHVLFFCVTGGRAADAVRARREDFDTEAWRILVRGSKTRDSWRTIPVPEFLRWYVRFLLAMAPGGDVLFEPWSEGSMNRDIKAACRRASLEPVSTNGLRRTFGHALRQHGYSLDVISKLFGHTTEKLARDVYADFTADELAAKVEKQGKR
jgi:integrase